MEQWVHYRGYDLQVSGDNWSTLFFLDELHDLQAVRFFLKKCCSLSSAGYTAGSSFLFATKVTKATRGHEGTSKELLCDQ